MLVTSLMNLHQRITFLLYLVHVLCRLWEHSCCSYMGLICSEVWHWPAVRVTDLHSPTVLETVLVYATLLYYLI